jgi:seryl-tRNA synthetase
MTTLQTDEKPHMMEYPLPSELDEKVHDFLISALERSFHTARVEIRENTMQATMADDITPEDFQQVMSRLLYVSRSINRDLLYQNDVDHGYHEDPLPSLQERKDVIPAGPGLFTFQGNFLKVMRGLQRIIRQLAEKYKAVEQEYPALWPVDLFKRINYFGEFPHQVVLATGVENNYRDREAFARKYSSKEEYNSIDAGQHLDHCRMGLQPSVCDLCYYALQQVEDHQNTVYTTFGKVYRNEVSAEQSLDRLLAFSVRDIMFVGDEQFVMDMRQHMIDEMIKFLEFLNLQCRIETANDPFFTNDSTIKNAFQYSSRLKYELLARLPYKDADLAVGSINHHLNFFGKAFDIRMHNGRHAYSGCLGIGFERLAFALYCQYGTDTQTWPADIRQALELD